MEGLGIALNSFCYFYNFGEYLMKQSKICLALDGLSLGVVMRLLAEFGGRLRAGKIHDLLDAFGPMVLRVIEALGVLPWVDYKIHDTKDTVALRVAALVKNGAKIITVHASGGVPMMQDAVKAAGDVAEIYAVTVLTSLDDKEIARIYGKDRTRMEIVHEFALMAWEAGVRTVVCSALEVGMLKQSPDLPGMRFLVPGTRSAGVALGQQKRSATPREAIDAGADELVAGSQVTGSKDPADAFEAFATEIGEPIAASHN